MIQRFIKRLAARRALQGMVGSLHKKHNNVDDRFMSRPQGATQRIQYCVAGFAKGATIAFSLRLVLNALGCSVPINTNLLEYSSKDIFD